MAFALLGAVSFVVCFLSPLMLGQVARLEIGPIAGGLATAILAAGFGWALFGWVEPGMQRLFARWSASESMPGEIIHAYFARPSRWWRRFVYSAFFIVATVGTLLQAA